MKRIPRLFLMAALLCCLTACSGGSAKAAFLKSIAVSEIPAGNGVTQSAELRAVRTVDGVRLTAQWLVEPQQVCAAVYSGLGQMLCVEGPSNLSSPWTAELVCDPNQAVFVKLFFLDRAYRPVADAVSALVEDCIPDETDTEGDGTMVGVFDFETKRVRLNSGYEMPILGLGTYSLTGQTCVDAVKAELRSGGRLIDTAYMYHNEEEVGRGVREAMEEYGIAREDIFVITKLYPNQFSDPETAIEQALSKLNIGYIDMMLLHHPGTGDVTAYKAMERYVEQGKIRSLGLSNWYVEELTGFLPQVSIPPALVQNEIHPYYQENDVVPFIQGKGIVVQCWYPLGGRGYTADLLRNDTILEIAGRHGVSSAQVILRWDLQRGIVVIPGSSSEAHIRENLDLFGFTLTQEEMDAIRALDRGEKHDWY